MRTLGTMIISYRCQLYTHFVLISCHYCRGRSYCWQVTVAGNSCRCKFASRLFKRNFRGFYCCGTNAGCSDHTPTSWCPHPICELRKWNWTTKEASLHNSLALRFLLCGDLRIYEGIKTATVGEKLRRCGLRDYVPTHIHLIGCN